MCPGVNDRRYTKSYENPIKEGSNSLILLVMPNYYIKY